MIPLMVDFPPIEVSVQIRPLQYVYYLEVWRDPQAQAMGIRRYQTLFE